MESVIMRYVDWDNIEQLTICSVQKMNKIRTEKAKQIIEVIMRGHTQEQRENMIDLSRQELYDFLTSCLEKNHLYNLRVN